MRPGSSRDPLRIRVLPQSSALVSPDATVAVDLNMGVTASRLLARKGMHGVDLRGARLPAALAGRALMVALQPIAFADRQHAARPPVARTTASQKRSPSLPVDMYQGDDAARLPRRR